MRKQVTDVIRATAHLRRNTNENFSRIVTCPGCARPRRSKDTALRPENWNSLHVIIGAREGGCTGRVPCQSTTSQSGHRENEIRRGKARQRLKSVGITLAVPASECWHRAAKAGKRPASRHRYRHLARQNNRNHPSPLAHQLATGI